MKKGKKQSNVMFSAVSGRILGPYRTTIDGVIELDHPYVEALERGKALVVAGADLLLGLLPFHDAERTQERVTVDRDIDPPMHATVDNALGRATQ